MMRRRRLLFFWVAKPVFSLDIDAAVRRQQLFHELEAGVEHIQLGLHAPGPGILVGRAFDYRDFLTGSR
ncbi:Uncharacterized [Moorella glycerini]|uniref:Uncharacterized protein n=1 Tax=Neomoorella stamsii TaxID=1266720 RepID=A0A9X7J0V1_9FIRM|nr:MULTISPECIES: hypothetical protein [Moorella]PRR71357.1 hypothetical protein MOST_24060 [Moorella stamsii]CEP66603.1 Uncharacterized [Moorella glycerini]CEP68565.1 Uncharacterized [Moorella glycerini]